MSGPKCGEYSVESNYERERRIAAELRAGIESAGRALETLRERWAAAARAYGSEFPSMPSQENSPASDDADNDTLRSILGQFRARLSALESELGEAESVHRIRGLLAKASAVGKAGTVPDVERANRNTVSIETRRQKVSAALDLLDAGAPNNERAVIEHLCAEALQKLHVFKFESTLLEIQLAIQKCNQKKKERDSVNAKVEQLLDKLTGLEGKDVSRLRRELVLARDNGLKLRSGIDAEVASAAAAAAAEEDLYYASKVLIEELEKLGYSTGEDMQTVLAEGGELQINNADLKEYAVCFAVDQSDNRFDVYLTRFSDAVDSHMSGERRLRDRSMEEKWCCDLASVLASVAERGLSTRITHRKKPGAVPVEVRNGNERRRSAAARRVRTIRS